MNSRQLVATVATLAISTSAFAYRAPSGTNYRSQPRAVDSRGITRNDASYGTSDRDLKQAIKAKRREAKQLRKAGDPRAAQAEQELRSLQDQRHQLHGRSRDNRPYDSRDDRRSVNRDRDEDREGDRVHGKHHQGQHDEKDSKNHDQQNHDDDDQQDDHDDQDR